MKKIIYSSTFIALLGGVFFLLSEDKKEYSPRNESNLIDQKHYVSDAPTAYAEAMEYYRMISANQITGVVDQKDVENALNSIQSSNSRRLAKNLNWNFVGPDNVGGRIRAFLIDRNNASIRYAGGVSGGLFKSTNRGFSWSVVNDMQENLNVTCIAQTPNGTILYGTGEGGFVGDNGTKDGTPGFAPGGIFKSTDGGVNFTRLNNTTNFGFCSIMASDSLKKQRVWVGTQAGLRYTDDEGATWVVARPGNCRDVQVAKDGTIFAYIGSNQVVRSTDGGATFQVLTIPFRGLVRRLRIAVSPTDENYVYVVAAGTITGIAGNDYMEGLYRSTDKGDNFTTIQPGGSPQFDPLSQVLTLQGQGNFDLCLTVDPLNKERVIIGGVQLGEWDNGVAKIIGSLADIPGNLAYCHADKHEFLWDYSTPIPTLIVSTDGGMYYSDDRGRTFNDRNKMFATTQFYGLAANASGHVIGGTQDNGTLFVNRVGTNDKSSVRVLGGDGFQTEISRTNPRVIFAESQYGNLRRSVNGGSSFAPIWDGRLTGEGAGTSSIFADFNAQFKLWEDETSGEGRLFFAQNNRIWVAIDALDASQEPSWFTLADNTNGMSGSGRVVDLEYSEDGGSLFVCRSANLFRIDGINLANFDTIALPGFTIDPNIALTNITSGLPSGRAITSINLDPNNPNRAVITLGNYGNTSYVFLSENILDAVPTYTNITGNLANFPVYDAIISTEDPNYIVLATEFGVWATENGGTTWEEQNQGMARVATYIIRQYRWKSWEGPVVYIATHGRGFFESKSLLTSVNKVAKKDNFTNLTAFPNPTQNITNLKFNLKVGESNASVKVLDMSGRIIKQINSLEFVSGTNQIKLDLSGIKSGNYIVTLTGANVSSSTRIAIY